MKASLFLILVVAFLGPFQALAAVLQRRLQTDVVGYAAQKGTNIPGGEIIRVSTLAEFTSAVADDTEKTVILTASLTGNTVVKIGSNSSVLGANPSITLNGIGLLVAGKTNVVIRNLRIKKVIGTTGDAIGIRKSSRVWIDHVDLSSVRSNDKDYYDGLLDITHGCTLITVSWSKFSDHCKTSLVGHSDDNCDEDKEITVTYHHNYWTNLTSRLPSVRCGRGHIFNNYYEDSNLGVDTRVGAQLQVERNVFSNVTHPVFADKGSACLVENDLGGGPNTAPNGVCFTPPYSYSLDATSSVKSIVTGSAGATLSF